MTIGTDVTQKRLAMCRDALLTEENISTIIHSYGFKDYSSFYRAFKKEYGISPKEYKEVHALLEEENNTSSHGLFPFPNR